MKKTCPNIADEIPASRTALACVECVEFALFVAEQLTNMAPATLNRSVIWVFIVVPLHLTTEISADDDQRDAGMMNVGSTMRITG